MKILSMLFVALLMCAPLAWAGDFDDFWDEDVRGNIYGVQLDAPNLIKVNDNLSIGAEVTKDIRQEAFEGYTFLVKATLPFTLWDRTQSE